VRVLLTGLSILLALVMLACDEPGEEGVDEANPSVTVATGTPSQAPSATASRDEAPTATPFAGRAPDGCLEEEEAYEDPQGRFAFCYPASGEISFGETPGGPAANVKVPIGENAAAILIVGIHIDPYMPCGVATEGFERNQREESMEVGSKSVVACLRDVYDPIETNRLVTTVMDMAVTDRMGDRLLIYASIQPVAEGEVTGRSLVNTMLRSFASQ
jgi:hypothetical protein